MVLLGKSSISMGHGFQFAMLNNKRLSDSLFQMFIDFLHFSPTFQWLSVGVPTTDRGRATPDARDSHPAQSSAGDLRNSHA